MKKHLVIAVLIFLSAFQTAWADGAAVQVKLETNQGDIVLSLDKAAAPKTVENFLQYTREGFYDSTIFHRVIQGFMIQGGGLTEDMVKKKTHPPIENEAANGLKNDRGTIAMARTGAPHSATAQFFINTVNNTSLNHRAAESATGQPANWGYCVFGKVTEGMDVVDKIEGSMTSNKGGRQNVPVLPIVILKASVLEADPMPAPPAKLTLENK